jgi:SOS-response transcriptional repressor LexA
VTAKASPSSPITPRQLDVLTYLWTFFAKNDQLPSKRALAAHFGWSSLNSAVRLCAALERRKLIERNSMGKLKFTEAGRALVGR